MLREKSDAVEEQGEAHKKQRKVYTIQYYKRFLAGRKVLLLYSYLITETMDLLGSKTLWRSYCEKQARTMSSPVCVNF